MREWLYVQMTNLGKFGVYVIFVALSFSHLLMFSAAYHLLGVAFEQKFLFLQYSQLISLF